MEEIAYLKEIVSVNKLTELYTNINTSTISQKEFRKSMLRNKIISSLEEQGFDVESFFKKDKSNILLKEDYRKLQTLSAEEQQKKHKKLLMTLLPTVKPYFKELVDIDPKKIKLTLIEVTHNSLYEKIYKWWNFAWWSMPFQRAYGRQMRFVIWDEYHNAPFGLIGLQSPVLKMSVRDQYLDIPKEELDIWVNQSMNAQRIGALPPYNELIGGKMVSLCLISNEIRKAYKNKYKDSMTLLENRHINPDLLFITTTSAFGRSSIYNRLKIEGHSIAKSLGFTKGYGSFHINDDIYKDIIDFLNEEGINTKRNYGNGPSKRIKLLNNAFRLLDIPGLEQHGLKREFFIFENVSNLRQVIQDGEKPKYYNYKFDELVSFWKKRWCIPRKERLNKNGNSFQKEKFINDLMNKIS